MVSIIYFSTSYKQVEFEIKNTVSFTLATQNMKYLAIMKYGQNIWRKLQNL